MDVKALAAMLDHTILKPDATFKEVEETIEYGREIGAASVCINPSYITLASGILRGSTTAVCTVIGFPLGATSSYSKAKETSNAWLHGAEEMDMVINIGALKSSEHSFVQKDIEAVVKASPALVKVILETCLLTDEEIVTACKICEEAGAGFVKTSTGFSTGGATAHAVELMRKSVSPAVKVKASGGIGSLADARAMIAAGADRLGVSRSKAILQELAKETAQ